MVLTTDVLHFSINMCCVLLRVTVEDRLSSSLTSPWFSSPVVPSWYWSHHWTVGGEKSGASIDDTSGFYYGSLWTLFEL